MCDYVNYLISGGPQHARFIFNGLGYFSGGLQGLGLILNLCGGCLGGFLMRAWGSVFSQLWASPVW